MANTRENEDQELGGLYDRYASLVYRRCRYILGSEDEAWDATQDVFMKLMACLPKIKNRAAVYSWLLSTSTNQCISMLRRKKGEPFDECAHGNEKDDIRVDKRLILREIINRLFRPWDKKIRDIVIYSYIDEYSQNEISQLTGLGESTIRKYLTRFKREAVKVYPDAKEVFNA
jgi:RNA polymerase sigma factor (sigma-70 family)